MDTRHSSPPDRLATVETITPEARGLFVAGWCAAQEEGRITHLADQTQQLVSPQTWRALRTLGACVAVSLPSRVPQPAG